MANIAKMARENQPGLLIVDRSVGGEFENYWTPEQHIPPQEEKLDYPWETCMTMANSWSYVPNDQYKSSKTLLKNLATIVSRGGNYLLNIAPSPSGEWDHEAYLRLKEIGQWIKVNGEAIYGTRRHALTTQTENYFYTQKGDTVYCIYFKKDGQEYPTYFPIEYPRKPESDVHLLGLDEPVTYEWKNGMNWKVKNINKSALANQPAIVFYFKWAQPASSK